MNDGKELQKALDNNIVTKVVLGRDFTSNASITRKVNLDLNGKTLTGNLNVVSDTVEGTITLGSGTLAGNLSVNTPKASFVNNATVTGSTLIEDVAPGTFTNNGTLSGAVTVTDSNGTRILNNGTLTAGLILETSGAVTLGGTKPISKVIVEQQTILTLEAETTVTTLHANANVEVTGSGTVTTVTSQEGIVISGDVTLAAEKAATDAVVKVEDSKIHGDYDAAMRLVESLHDGAVKIDLTKRLVTVKLAIASFISGVVKAYNAANEAVIAFTGTETAIFKFTAANKSGIAMDLPTGYGHIEASFTVFNTGANDITVNDHVVSPMRSYTISEGTVTSPAQIIVKSVGNKTTSVRVEASGIAIPVSIFNDNPIYLGSQTAEANFTSTLAPGTIYTGIIEKIDTDKKDIYFVGKEKVSYKDASFRNVNAITIIEAEFVKLIEDNIKKVTVTYKKDGDKVTIEIVSYNAY